MATVKIVFDDGARLLMGGSDSEVTVRRRSPSHAFVLAVHAMLPQAKTSVDDLANALRALNAASPAGPDASPDQVRRTTYLMGGEHLSPDTRQQIADLISQDQAIRQRIVDQVQHRQPSAG